MKNILYSLLVIALIAIGCTKNKAEEIKEMVVDPCADTVSYAQFINAKILSPNCNTSGCHSASAAGGYNFTTYDAVESNAALIYNVISHAPGAKPMPLGGQKLSDSLITKFKCWMDQGKLNN